MDPVQRSVTALLSALRGVEAVAPTAGMPAAPLAALRNLVGQDVSLLLLGTQGEQSRLALPSGQVISAQGELPFPEGTQLWMRVLEGEPGSGQVRLRTLSAQAPQPAEILAPLLQGEGTALLQRLQQPDPAPALAPLAELLKALAPEEASLGVQVEALPPATQAALREALGVPPETDLAGALKAWARNALGQGDAMPEGGAPEGLPAAMARLLQAVAERHPEAPREALGQVLKQILGLAQPAARPSGGAPGGAPAPSQARPASAPALPLPGAPGAATPAQAETWESWLRTAVRTLADPGASPREAPFHLAQAREGTAFFEIPLPWSPQSPLQMWVEADREGEGQGDRDRTRTVLLGLSFTRLGETRLGIAKGPSGLQVRVWAEHPEVLSGQQEQVEEELRELGSPVDLRILPLQPGPGGFVPSLKSLLSPPSIQALG